MLPTRNSRAVCRMKNFALIGAAGYIAPRHMQAIQATGNRLVAAIDPSDSVGIIDSYFPDAPSSPNSSVSTAISTSFDAWRRRRDRLRLDLLAQLSARFAHPLRAPLRADVICEKPLVLNPWNIDGLSKPRRPPAAGEHDPPVARPPGDNCPAGPRSARPRAGASMRSTSPTSPRAAAGMLYSWKGDEKKSGGIATNIGVHFFDMLHFIFGDLQQRGPSGRPGRAAAIWNMRGRGCAGSFRSIGTICPRRSAVPGSGPSARSRSTARRSSFRAASATSTPGATS